MHIVGQLMVIAFLFLLFPFLARCWACTRKVNPYTFSGLGEELFGELLNILLRRSQKIDFHGFLLLPLVRLVRGICFRWWRCRYKYALRIK